MKLLRIADDLARRVGPLQFGPPVAYVYNPLTYARDSYRRYLTLYGREQREVLMFGMNPGPFGMAQTGVPFGEVTMVRDWLGICESVGKPPREHPRRPILGFACPRREVSGKRLWGWARDTFGTPQRFFKRFFIANYCPLCFLDSGGRNLTPDKLPARHRAPLLEACDLALQRTVEYLHPRWVIGIGQFAESRARAALAGFDVKIGTILHPSPASPKANRDWAAVVTRQFASFGIIPLSKP
jgi:single-strand selective monofunctional uracil DNA glycosylase